MTMKIYQDLDGCLADFDKRVTALFNGQHPKRDLGLKDGQMWKRIIRDDGFFEKLEWIEGAKAVWEYIRPTNPTILTGLPIGGKTWADPQKRSWVARELGPDIHVITCMSREKRLYAQPGHLLLDDRLQMVEEWREDGGDAILWQNPQQVMEELLSRDLTPSRGDV